MASQSKWNWNALSQYRLQLFGLSIISIIIFHYFEHVMNGYPEGGFWLFSKCYNLFIGSIGVEIFLFLSGMGLYFSMSHNDHIGQFYRKRFQRVLTPYLIWGLLYWGWKDLFVAHQSTGQFLLDYTTLSLWLQGNKAMWYVSFIMLMYLLFPLLFRFMRKENPHRGILTAVFICGSFGCTMALKFIFPDIYDHAEIALYRIPVFLLGTYYGQAVAEKKTVSKMDISLIIFGILLKIGYFLGEICGISYLDKLPSRAIQCFYCLSFLFLFAMLGKVCCQSKFNSILTFCGNLSFELYITHVALRNVINVYGMKTYIVPYYLFCILLSVLCSIALSKITNLILSRSPES